jgi:hypothetical protein
MDIGGVLKDIQLAVVTGSMDIVTIGEFTAINYINGMILDAVSPSLPGGFPGYVVRSGITSAADIAKLIIFSSMSKTVAAPTTV